MKSSKPCNDRLQEVSDVGDLNDRIANATAAVEADMQAVPEINYL